MQTLGDLYLKGSTAKACALAVVVDCSAPYRGKDSTDWIVRAKLIDHTLNEHSAIGEEGSRYCLAFFFAAKAENLPRVTEVGSIVYLRRADFSFWQANKFKAKLGGKKYTSWVLLSGDPSRLDLCQLQTNREDLDSEDRFNLRASLVELRAFSFNYFREHSLQLISCSEESTDFDFLFKVTGCEPSFNRFRLTLADGKQIFLMYSDVEFEEGVVVKVRSIARIEWGDTPTIKPNDYTWGMRVPDWMASFKEGGVVAIQRQQQPREEPAPAPALPLSTAISEGCRDLPAEVLAELLRGEERGRVRVKCWVTDIPVDSYAAGLRKMADRRLLAWGSQAEGANIYHMPLLLQDGSLEDSRGCFLAYLLSFDGKGDEFFSGLHPKHIYGQNVTVEQEAFRKFKNDLIEHTCEQNQLEMVLEPLRQGGQCVWRIVETRLQDFL